jgi:hypothetical protein
MRMAICVKKRYLECSNVIEVKFFVSEEPED